MCKLADNWHLVARSTLVCSSKPHIGTLQLDFWPTVAAIGPMLRLSMVVLKYKPLGGDRFEVVGVNADAPNREVEVGIKGADGPGRPPDISSGGDVDWENGLLPKSAATRPPSRGDSTGSFRSPEMFSFMCEAGTARETLAVVLWCGRPCARNLDGR